jgi:pyridoxine 4-dehydrogenase
MKNGNPTLQQEERLATKAGEFLIGGDLRVTRLGFGAMRITGDGIWGEPANRPEAVRVFAAGSRVGNQFHRHSGFLWSRSK